LGLKKEINNVIIIDTIRLNNIILINTILNTSPKAINLNIISTNKLLSKMANHIL